MTKTFARFARRNSLGDELLCDAVKRAVDGLVAADLGGGVIKQRVARPGQGRSGGYRTIIAFRVGDRAVFMYGFAKSEANNIPPEDLRDLRDAAEQYLALTQPDLDKAVAKKALIELTWHE